MGSTCRIDASDPMSLFGLEAEAVPHVAQCFPYESCSMTIPSIQNSSSFSWSLYCNMNYLQNCP